MKIAFVLAVSVGVCFTIYDGRAIEVSRGQFDVFNNPNLKTCKRNVRYCRERRARCFSTDCCKCICNRGYSTFHSPGLTYKITAGKPVYAFNSKDTCVWNHYAHEGLLNLFIV